MGWRWRKRRNRGLIPGSRGVLEQLFELVVYLSIVIMYTFIHNRQQKKPFIIINIMQRHI